MAQLSRGAKGSGSRVMKTGNSALRNPDAQRLAANNTAAIKKDTKPLYINKNYVTIYNSKEKSINQLTSPVSHQ